MAAPITADWANTDISDASLNKTTYGQGTSFPSTWPVDRLFWRSDIKRMYYNRGTEGTPDWEGSDTPVGTINMYAGATTDVPSGWLLCDGTAVSRTTYSRLFDILDTKYGTGDGSTTFNLPDFVTSNSFPRAATNDAGRGTTGGESTHTLLESEMPTHTHIQDAHNHDISRSKNQDGAGTGDHDNVLVNDSSSMGLGDGSIQSVTVVNQNTGGGSSHENKPPFIDVHFIIAV